MFHGMRLFNDFQELRNAISIFIDEERLMYLGFVIACKLNPKVKHDILMSRIRYFLKDKNFDYISDKRKL